MSLNSIQESLFKKIEHIDDIVKKRNGQFTINKFQSLFDVTRTEPIYHHPRRTSNEMQEIIRAVVIVRKKDGTPRFCVDYRKINSVTEKDVYPLPRIDEIIDQLSQATWFLKLDLKNGYFQVSIAEEDHKV